MRHKTMFIFLLLPLLCLGQTKYKSGKITYGVDINIEAVKELESSNKVGEQYLTKALLKVKQNAPAITGVLKYNSNTAHFFAEDGLENEAERGYKSALMHFGVDGPYYVDLTKKEILQKSEAFGKTYLVEEEFAAKQKWKVSAKNKHIGNYKVYKATTVKVVVNSKGTFKSEVIAWFAPETPFGYGPLGYGGLPGLILELEVKSNFPVRYFAKSTEFGQEEIKLEIPSKAKRNYRC